MKYLRTLLGLLVFAGSLFIFGGAIASAHIFQTGTNAVVNQKEPIQHTIFVAGQSVDISSEVFGDVFCAGQTVTISGPIHGDVICAGQTVNVTGHVDGDVRLAGQTVNVNGNVAGSATIAGQSFNLDSRATIGRDLSVGTSSATINGSVDRDVAIGGQTVSFAGTVGRDIRGDIDSLYLSPSAVIKGNIAYTSAKDLHRATGATVGGTVTRTEPTKQSSSNKRGAMFGFSFGWFVYCLLATLVTGLVIALCIPGFLHRSGQRLFDHPVKTFFVGFIASIVVPVLTIVLFVTVVGIPLALMVGLLWLVILFASIPFAGYVLGRLVLRRTQNIIWAILAGITLVVILDFVPIVGVITFLAALWFGAGMILLGLTSVLPRPAYSLAEHVTSVKEKHHDK